MATGREYRYPPDVALGFDARGGSFTAACLGLVALAAVLDLVLFGFPETPIPYNYPFFGDVVLLAAVALLLRATHGVMWRAVDELALIAERNREDPLSPAAHVDGEDVRTELVNVLYLGYHPVVLGGGALAGGALVVGIMAALGVFSAYPYLLLDFGFGAAHGVFLGPAVAGAYLVVRALEEYIVDIDLMDPDGVGGYREIGNGIVTVASYGILVVTLDFLILSSVAFTEFTDFQLVVTGLYLLVLVAFSLGSVGITSLVRRKLLAVRDRKVDLMQEAFVRQEHAYWEKQMAGGGLAEAVHILAMQSMFHQLNRMSLWPINLPSLLKLGASAGFSLLVFLLESGGFLF